jgi:hypothetical protein
MSDFALNRITNSLVSNDRDEHGNFKPTPSMAHIAGTKNYHQHGNHLYGCEEGDLDELGRENLLLCQEIGPKKGAKKTNETNSEIEKVDETNRRKLTNCQVCGKNALTPNDYMAMVLQKQIKLLKENKKRTPDDLIRSQQLISAELEQYRLLNVYHYFPNRKAEELLPGFELQCWNGPNCAVPEKSERKNKTNFVGKVTENKWKVRAVEGLNENGFVIIPEYYCSKCEQVKAASDSAAMEAMGIPLVVMRASGLVFLEKSVWTMALYKFVVTSMTGSMGAEQIEKTVAKMHMDRYLEDGVTFMEAQLLLKKRNARSMSLEDYGFGSQKWDGHVVAWPSTESHCQGGLGRLTCGPLKTQITEVFLGSAATLVKFAHAIEASVGGTTVKGDGNYSIPKKISMDAGPGQYVKPTCLQASKFL